MSIQLDLLPAEPPAVPIWRQTLLMLATDASHLAKSRDLYRELYGPAYDHLVRLGDVRECIALVINYVEVMLDEQLVPAHRKQIALLVRKYGKAALHGLDRALGITDMDDFTAAFRYARATAERVVREHRPMR